MTDAPDSAIAVHPARFFESYPDREGTSPLSVRCTLCPHACVIGDGSVGRCLARVNHGGALIAASYGIVSSLALDPIEKKPFARFYPGSKILSVGGFGCNLSCRFCQNHEISRSGIPGISRGEGDPLPYKTYAPEALVRSATDLVGKGNIGLAFTYNEPLIAWEYVHDTAQLAREAGLKTVLVTNGYARPEAVEELLPLIDAMNIDLKAFTNTFYRKICGGTLEPVLDTIGRCVGRCHVEVTTLVIPGHNSAPAEIDALARWLASVSPEVPLHLNRHHPDYHMVEPQSIPADELRGLVEIARKHLKFVYCGNL
jgi:pyruvate formate lyase activating enzyme